MSGRGRAGVTRTALQKELLTLLETLPAVQVQNRLMACTDRDVALSLLGVPPDRLQTVLQSVSARKASRVLAEIALEERRRVEDRCLALSLQTVITSLSGDRPAPGTRSYVRPRRPEREDKG